MQVNMKGLIDRLNDLRGRINGLLNNLDTLEDLDQEDIEIETVQQYFQNDDTLNLAVALDILEQADRLDKALEYIKEMFIFQPDKFYPFIPKDLTKIRDEEKINLLKEVFL